MRELFEQQQSLLAELQGRLEQASERRQRRVELLKGLWLEVASLRAAATQAPDNGTSERLQALCARLSSLRAADAVPDDDTPTVAQP